MTEDEINQRAAKLLALVAMNNWTITEAAAREYVVLEAKQDKTEAELKRKRAIIAHATGKVCTCGSCTGDSTGR